jgi:hypothetical protein
MDCLILNPESGETVKDVYKDPAVIVNLIVRNLFVLAGVAIFLMIIYAGFKFAMSPESKDKEDAKSIAQGAGIGFLIMFSAFWIIQIIEIVTGLQNII